MHFKPTGPWFSKKCDDNYDPPLCSDKYHSQEQSPGYPHGDGDCAAPACDCGKVPCGFYIFNHSSTAIVNGQTFRDWFIHDYMINEVGRSDLVSGFFWDDVWNEDCNIHDQVPHTCDDMGLVRKSPEIIQLTKDYRATMEALRNATLSAGKFSWQMLWTGGADGSIGSTCPQPLVKKDSCAADLRSLCQPTSAAQTRAMMYAFGPGRCNGAASVKMPDLHEDLANFLLTRGPYAWLGHGWLGCSQPYVFPPELNVDYGEPKGLCAETSAGSGVFVREWTKATVSMDCNTWTPKIVPK